MILEIIIVRRHSDKLPDLTIETKEGYPCFKLQDLKSKTNTKLSFILNSSDQNKTNHQYNFDRSVKILTEY